MRGTILAHVDGRVPNILLTVPGRDERSLGALIYADLYRRILSICVFLKLP